MRHTHGHGVCRKAGRRPKLDLSMRTYKQAQGPRLSRMPRHDQQQLSQLPYSLRFTPIVPLT